MNTTEERLLSALYHERRALWEERKWDVEDGRMDTQFIQQWPQSEPLVRKWREQMPLFDPPNTKGGDGENHDRDRRRVFESLNQARSAGRLNYELVHICIRFGARIFELRKAGFAIKTEKAGARAWRYTLAPEHWTDELRNVRIKRPF